jgi:HPt (histidine-containing phosphotransfer) domain-containing protein
VPEELVTHLFKPFSPGDTSYARAQQGAGLGLAVVKRLVDSVGGEVGFESEPGQGATFWFTVPQSASAPNEHAGTAPGAGSATAPAGLALLAFARDAGVHTQLANMLEPFGNQIHFAETIADAIMQAARGTFDAILVDAAVADQLAAAPGVKAPILALLLPGERSPVCANEVLHWPAPAHVLYGALAAIGERAREENLPEATPQGSIAAINAAEFAALEKSLGMTTLIEILKSYIETAEKLCAALGEASEGANWQEAARLAQDIAGSAGGLGLAAMTAAARGFTQQAREGANAQDLRNTAQIIAWEHERVRRALANLYPDLVA